MIRGIGIDVIENKRFAKVMLRKGVVKRIFTYAERQYCEPKLNKLEHFAGRLAAKEAVLKALGTGLAKGISWQDIEIKKEKNGSVAVNLRGNAKKLARQKKINRLHLSITHTKNYAAAFAIAES